MKNRRSKVRQSIHLLVGLALFAAVAWPFWQEGYSISPPFIPNSASTAEPYEPIQFQLMNPQGQPVSGATFSIVNGALPPGLTLTSAGVLSGTPTEGGFYSFAVGGQHNPSEAYAEGYYDIYVYNDPVITTTTLPAGQVGIGYSGQLTGARGVPPYYFEVVGEYLGGYGGQSRGRSNTVSGARAGAIRSGSRRVSGIGERQVQEGEGPLPPGLELNSETGAITGTPTEMGVYLVRFGIWDSQEGYSSKVLTIVISPPVFVTTRFLPDAPLGSPYAVQLESAPSGTGFTWSVVNGSLPPGLTLGAATGLISGTPTQLGAYPFAVTVTTSSSYGGTTSAPVSLQIQVSNPELTLSPLLLPPGMVGTPYHAVFEPSGGSGSYVLSQGSGTLPTGLTFNASTRTLSGTPTEEGRFRFGIRVQSGPEVFERLYSVLIEPQRLTVQPPELPSGYVGLPYTAQLTATGGAEPYTFAITSGQPPPGLTLASNGALTGTPTTLGSYSLVVTVTDATSVTASRTYPLQIAERMTVTPSQLPDATTGQSYTGGLIVTGGVAPIVFTLAGGALPAGMQLRPGGTITGTPSVIGSYRFTARATDANRQVVDTEIGLNVIGAVSIDPLQLAPATLGVPYSQPITVSGGVAPYTLNLSGTLPPGITFSDAAFSGAPQVFGDFPLSLSVSDASGKSATRLYTLSVPRTVVITTQSLPSGTAGTAYAATVQAAGGRPPYLWSTLGTLPAGLAIDAESGMIAGTPTESGDFSFVVEASDREGVRGTRNFSLSIAVPPPPQVTITQLPSTSPPGQQPGFGVQTSAPYPLPLNGMVTLTFAPDSGPDDPAVQFASGGRTSLYTVPANATSAQFPGAPAVQTGTVAGLITLTTRYSAAGSDVTPDPPPTQTLRVQAASPTITSVQLARTSSSITVTILGFSSTREVSSALIRFTAASDANLQTQSVTVQVGSEFQQWFASPQSAEFGGQFRLVIPLNVSGDTSGIASASAQLTNSQGAGNTVTANF